MGPVHFDMGGNRDFQQVVEDCLENQLQIPWARGLREPPNPDFVATVAIVQIFQVVLHIPKHKALARLLGLDLMDSEISGLQVHI